MLKTLKTLLFSAVFLCLSGAAFAQVSALEGDVKGPDGAPIKGAVVQIDRKDIKGSYNVKTDKKGHYGHYGLPLGTYKVTVVIDGQMRDSVDNVRTKLGDPTPVNFDLHAQQQQQQAAQTGTLTKEQERSMSPEQKAAFDKQVKQREAALSKNKALNDSFNQGKAALEAKQYDQAVDAFSKASEMDATQPVIWAQLGEAYIGESNAKPTEADALRQKGIDAYKKAIDLKPDEAAYYNNYALALAKAKQIEPAQQALQKAAELDAPGAGRYYYNLGAVLVNTNQNEAAGQAFKKAIDLDPNYADAQYQYAVYLISKASVAPDGKVTPVPGTVEALEKYMTLKPDGPFAESAKGMLASIQGTVATKYENPNEKASSSASKKSNKKK